MKRYFLVALAAALFIPGSLLSAQEPAKPGPEHKMLAEVNGTWDAEFKMPDGTTSKCEATFKTVCDGLWVMSTFTGEIGGMKFEGRGIDGYDQDKKKYVSTWIDSMTSSPMHFEGTYDKESKTLTQVAEGKNMEGKPAKFKSTTKYDSKDQMTFKMFVVGAENKDELMMTVVYKRRK